MASFTGECLGHPQIYGPRGFQNSAQLKHSTRKSDYFPTKWLPHKSAMAPPTRLDLLAILSNLFISSPSQWMKKKSEQQLSFYFFTIQNMGDFLGLRKNNIGIGDAKGPFGGSL